MTTESAALGYKPAVLIKAADGEVVHDNAEPTTPNKEKEKYEKLWGEISGYRDFSPGEQFASVFLQQVNPRAGATVIDFGCGTGKGSLNLVVLGRVKVVMLDFTGNSLDEDIKNMLVTQKDMMSFVQADLEKPLPVAAQYGYCTDVMEHIPPEKVDVVLDNILKAAQHVFFAISTVPDHFGQTIGETLHLTVQPYEWWLKKLRDRDATIHWSQGFEGGCFFYCSAWTSGADVVKIGHLNTADDAIFDNIKTNLVGGYKVCVPHNRQEQSVLLLGGGPSLKDFWPEIIEKRKAGQPLVTINGTYNEAIERGLKPSAQIVVDAREFNKRFVVPHVDTCKYLLASQAHPAIFEAAPKDQIWIWHATSDGNEPVKKILDEFYEPQKLGWFPVPGGSSAMLRAFPLLRMLGFCRFEVYGFDSCLIGDKHHAYSQPENDSEQLAKIQLDGRIFYGHPWMISQAEEFMDLSKMMGDQVEMIVKGDGLIAHIIKTGAKMFDAEHFSLD